MALDVNLGKFFNSLAPQLCYLKMVIRILAWHGNQDESCQGA